jgi:hypothetical protein
MKVLILTSVVSSTYACTRGDKPDLSTGEATRLINAGYALPLVELTTFTDDIEVAVEGAGYTVMPSGAASTPAPSGGYYWQNELLNLVHPSGARATIDPLHLLPTARP